MNDQELMQSIKTQWGPQITAACQASSVPQSFLAALVANESGGNQNATRFEPGVFASLAQVLTGTKSAYGSIGKQDLLVYCLPDALSVGVQDSRAAFTGGLIKLASLATSFGLVQIMGYETIPFHLTGGVATLQSPEGELPVAIKMLAQFNGRFGLDVTQDFSELFDCWNSGRPHAPTADPQYIPNGLRRKAIYEALP